MADFLSNIYLYLYSGEGLISYHTVLLLFSSLVLLASISIRRFVDREQLKRLIIGLILLLVMQLLLLVMIVLIHLNIFIFEFSTILNQVLELLSLIVIVWLWAFRAPDRRADWITVIAAFLATITVGIINYWSSIPGTERIAISSLPFWLVDAFSVAILVVGLFFLAIRRGALFGFGILMLGLLLFGFIALIWGNESLDFIVELRIAHLLAYPLLFLLPLRLVLQSQSSRKETDDDLEKVQLLQHIERQQAILDSRPSFTDPKVLQSLFDMVSDTDPKNVCRKITATISRIMQADLCLHILAPNEFGECIIECGYNLKRGSSIESVTLDGSLVPNIQSALRSGNDLYIDGDKKRPDKDELSKKLNLEKTGPIYFVPVQSEQDSAKSGIVILSPFSGRDWTQGDQYYLSILAKLMVHFLQHSREITDLKEQLTQAQFVQQQLQLRLEATLVGKQVSIEQKAVTQQRRVKGPSKFESLTSSYQDRLASILSKTVMRSGTEWVSNANQWVPESLIEEITRLKGELQLALEEIALLRAALDEQP